MTSSSHLQVLRGNGGEAGGPLLTLSNFPLGSLGGASVPIYRTKSGRLHLNRNCPALSRSYSLQEEAITLPACGSLADCQLPDAHCGPKGELGAYLSTAYDLCAVAKDLPLIAERLGVPLSDPERSGPHFSDYTRKVDWQAITAAWEAQVKLAEVSGNRTKYTMRELGREHQALVQKAVKRVAMLADMLYERALEQARSDSGRQSIGRILAAVCVRKGRLPRQYAPIYQGFRNTVARALKSLEGTDRRLADGLADFLEDRCYFDFALQWLEVMEDAGDPDRAAVTLNEEMTRSMALKDSSLQQVREFVLQIVGLVGIAYLDGLRAHGEEPVLVLAATHESPFLSYTPLAQVLWDVFPSAVCRLRGEHRGDPDEEARVAVVPRLWVDGVSRADEPSMGGEFVVLAWELDHLQRTSELCSAVAMAVGRGCDAGILKCRQWSPMSPTRRAYERAAREAAAPVLGRRW